MNLSPRDRAILRAEVADKIEQLLPLTQLGLDWRPTFQAQVDHFRSVANGRPAASEDRRDALNWSAAHAFLLDEVA